MYLPFPHAEHHIPTIVQFLRKNTLGLLITGTSSATHPTLQASHIPWVIDPPTASEDAQGFPRLRGHLARQNPQAKAIIEAVANHNDASSSQQLKDEILIMFQSPVHHYITPKFYTSTKPTTGKTVPTWDYEAVQVYGKATIYHSSSSSSMETRDFLLKQTDALTKASETEIMGYTPRNDGSSEDDTTAWEVSDAPESYVSQLMKNIIGIEVEVTRMEGRWKMSQEKPAGDREGVIAGFEKIGGSVGEAMAETIKERCKQVDARKAAIKAQT